MLSAATADTVSVDLGNGSTIEYAHDLLEELRRLAVAGLVSFARGGLEIGGVLYGLRDGTRLTIHRSVEFSSEHARGPGFLLSEKDRPGFAQLLEPPPGLETLGWYRAHTRSGLHPDAGDRELFDQFPADGKIIGLVLKPTHWGPSAAAFYVRECGGEIVPQEPQEFTVNPPVRPPQELSRHEESLRPVIDQAVVVASTEPQAPVRSAYQPARSKLFSSEKRLPIAIGVAVILVAATLAARFLSRYPHDLGLQAYAVAPGQLRIAWNRNSLPAVEGVSGIVEIRDGSDDTRIPLNSSQLRLNGITYTQKTGHVEVDLRVQGRKPGMAPAQESIEFVGNGPASVPPSAPVVEADAQPDNTADRRPVAGGGLETESRAVSPAPAQSELQGERPVKPSVPVRGHFEPPAPRKKSAISALPLLPAAPSAVPVTQQQQPALPNLFLKTPMVPRPVPPAGQGPRSGRLIWTGKLGRHELVEIEGGWSSVGSLSGPLSGMPAEFRILPAELTRDGLAIYTTDGSIHGRTEPPSQSNGWNPVTFVFDPVRVKELVVMEAPSRLNSFKRLVLRCDSRTCPVVVVDWTAH